MPIPRFFFKKLRASVGHADQLNVFADTVPFGVATTNRNVHGNLAEGDPGAAWDAGWANGPITTLVGSELVRMGRTLHIFRPLCYTGPAYTPPPVGTALVQFRIFLAMVYGGTQRLFLTQGGDAATDFFIGALTIPYCARMRFQLDLDNTGSPLDLFCECTVCFREG